MPDPVSMISAYPSSEINNIIKELKPSKLNVYIDLKNVMRSLFIEDVVNEMIHNSKMMGKVDSSIFQSVLNISSYWKKYAHDRMMEANIYICSDMGESSYHTAIYDKYKESRKVTNVLSEICGDKIKFIRDRNFIICENICNKLPNIYFFCLKFLESDFLPYYLITRKFYEDDNILHIVCSNDKDLYQCVLKPNIIQTYKSREGYVVLRDNTILTSFVRAQRDSVKSQLNHNLMNLDPKHIVSIMALCGDAGDDVPGIKGVGRKTAAKLICDIDISNKLMGDPDSICKRIFSGGKLLLEDENPIPDKWKNIINNNDLVTDAYKLISFEMLCLWLENKDKPHKIDMIKYMDKLLNKDDINMIPSVRCLEASLDNIEDLNLSKRSIENIFI